MMAPRGMTTRMATVSRCSCFLSSVQRGRTSQHIQRSFSASTKSVNDIKISPWHGVVGGLAVTVLGGAKYVHDHFDGTEGLQRTVNFYSTAIPKYFIYRYHMFMDSPDEVWDDLDRETSQMGLEKILELKGFYIKSGQMCAANIGNAFPEIWQDTMSVLQDQVPPKDWDTVCAIVENDMKKPLSECFATFEREPIGAASIGQVHRATLLDGTPVVVKVQYPEVERLFRGDVRTIKLFCQVAQPVHVPALNEIEKQFMTEFDYKKEALQLATVRENLTKAGLAGPNSLCWVPKPYLDMCSKNVLVMEELKGDKLSDGLKKDLNHNAERAGKTPKEFMAEQKAKEAEAKAKGEELHGPNSAQYNRYIQILETRRKVENASKKLFNVTLGLLPFVQPKEYAPRSFLPINHAKMIDDLLYVHGHEVLVDGYFNGDPHPGNILLVGTEEGSPKLGLIDYGQVKRVPKNMRLLFCKLIVALAEDNRKEIVQLMKEAGFKSKHLDEDVIYLYAKVGYDEDNDELTNGKHIQLFMEDLQSRDPIDALPRDFLMISRCSIMLRGLAHALHQSRSVAHAWKPIAEKVLKEEGLLK